MKYPFSDNDLDPLNPITKEEYPQMSDKALKNVNRIHRCLRSALLLKTEDRDKELDHG